MTEDPERILAELRTRLAAEGLPKLSPEALRAAKLDKRHCRPAQPAKAEALALSDEARRLYQQKSDPHWPWRKPSS
jgi:hypothetical protein